MVEERTLTIDEVAERLHLAPLTVADRLRAGSLPGFKLGRAWRVREEDLNRYIREQAEAGAIERRKRAAKAASKPPRRTREEGTQ